MGKSQQQTAQSKANSVLDFWAGVLTADDFNVPSSKTEIAKVAQVVTTVGLDFATIGDTLLSETISDQDDPYQQVLQSWNELSEEEALDRRAKWPQFNANEYKPRSAPLERIEDNIRAIEVVKGLQSNTASLCLHDRAAMLRYCGWGGLAKVFGPDETLSVGWLNAKTKLKALLSEQEYEAAQSSVLTAYYTDTQIVAKIWGLIERLGFEGGRVLEPSAGVGHFLAGMPMHLASASDITACELDAVSAQMLSANFANLDCQIIEGAFEKAKLPTGQFDLVVGNVPFADHKSLDTSKAEYANWSLHNYFIGRSVDLVRPGGLVVVLTSRHTLDSQTQSHREWLNVHANLVGAFRLPTMAFGASAGTEAVTDLLVFQRREVPDFAVASQGNWITQLAPAQQSMAPNQSSYGFSNYGTTTRVPSINGHFAVHPSRVFGELTWETGQYRENLNPVFKGTVQELCQKLEAVFNAEMPEGVYAPRQDDSGVAPRTVFQRYGVDTEIAPGSFVLHNTKICMSEGETLLDVDEIYTATTRQRMLALIELKRVATAVVEHQSQSDDDVTLQYLQEELNRTYDAMVKQLGFVTQTANARVFRTDPEWPLLLALEVWEDEAEEPTKADIFTKRTVGKRQVPQAVGSARDAMLISLALYGRIVFKDMVARYGKSKADIKEEFQEQGIAFNDPELRRWVPADEYLSGHIRNKITVAKASGPNLLGNIAALEAVLPSDLGPKDVEARLGSPWIPTSMIEQFAKELVNDPKSSLHVTFDEQTATWAFDRKGNHLAWVGDSVVQRATWGTKDRCALELLLSALNQQQPTVTRTSNGNTFTDKPATIAAREKMEAIRGHFRKWIYAEDDRRDALLRLYNDEFNQIVPRRFDGSHLVLPGMSMVVTPYPHQKDAIWRMMIGGNTLLAHCVGAGKTLEMVCAAMELRRLSKANKPAHVVPNHMLEQYTAEFKRLYPNARVLMATKDDLHGVRRRTFAARVCTGDFDSVIMTQSTFERLPVSPSVQRSFIKRMLDEIRLQLKGATDRGAQRSIKEIEKKLKHFEAQLERAVTDNKADQDCVWFDELGIDYLFLDEAHAYKNMAKITKMPRISGLPNTQSQRAFDVFVKTRLLMDARDGAQEGVVMATATPLTNSLAEAHTYQVYLQPQTLKRLGLYEFDAWSGAFGESVTAVEVAPDGSGFRLKTRYARFVNTPEMMAIFREVADIKTKKMLNLPTPRIASGKPIVVECDPSDQQLQAIEELVKRAESLPRDPKIDNMLKVTNDGRKLALDMRMIDQFAAFDPECKIAKLVINAHRVWEQGQAKKVTQLIFSDMGTPGGNGFNAYAEIKRLLIEKGVPAEQIEFVHDHDTDAAKAKLFKRVRAGAVRFLIGSTSKMGVGTNVQRLLKAVHQLDAPWVPSDVEQRDGRAHRQGNENEEIELYRYVTRRSFDAYSWNILTVKATFIEQVMTAESGVRTVEDIGMSALTYAEIKAIATGNPLVMEKAGIDAEINRLMVLESEHRQTRWSMKNTVDRCDLRMRDIDAKMPKFEATAQNAQQQLDVGSFKFVTRDPIAMSAYKDHGDSGEACSLAVMRVSAQMRPGDCKTIGKFAGFDVQVEKRGETNVILLDPANSVQLKVDRSSLFDHKANAVALVDAVKQLAQYPAYMRAEYGRRANEKASAQAQLNAPFEHEARLDELQARQREIESLLDLDKNDKQTEEVATTSE